LVLVVSQGVLGGMRVVYNQRALAMFHGTTGPVFFALAVAMAVFTSRRWRRSESTLQQGQLPLLAIVTCVVVYLQIVLGAVVRHVPVGSEPATFALAVRFHLFMAAIVSMHVVALVGLVLTRARRVRPLGGLATTLAGLLTLQLLLGAGTWIVKFAAPTWAPSWLSPGQTALEDGGWLQTHVITGHVAVGSLMLATSLALALYAVRLFALPGSARERHNAKLEAAV
jgi:cytochrome c oxidase assembly protein subunit 15